MTILDATPSVQDLLETVPLEEPRASGDMASEFTEYMKVKGMEYATTNKYQFTSYAVVTVVCSLVDMTVFVWNIIGAMRNTPVRYTHDFGRISTMR